jgi:hypothetical protein
MVLKAYHAISFPKACCALYVCANIKEMVVLGFAFCGVTFHTCRKIFNVFNYRSGVCTANESNKVENGS